MALLFKGREEYNGLLHPVFPCAPLISLASLLSHVFILASHYSSFDGRTDGLLLAAVPGEE